jgi:preprotein translocase subunit SecB
MNNNENDNFEQNNNQNSQIAINVQYVKDLSFENPNAPMSLTSIKEQPKVDLNLDIEAHKLQENVYEVVLEIKSSVKVGESNIFAVDLKYAGVFTLVNIPEDQVEALLFVHCPSILFPFARRVVADVTRDGGFQPLMIDPIDFFALYQKRKSDGEVQKAVIN